MTPLPALWALEHGALRAPSGLLFPLPTTRADALALVRYVVGEGTGNAPAALWAYVRATLSLADASSAAAAHADASGAPEEDIGHALAVVWAVERWGLAWDDAEPAVAD